MKKKKSGPGWLAGSGLKTCHRTDSDAKLAAVVSELSKSAWKLKDGILEHEPTAFGVCRRLANRKNVTDPGPLISDNRWLASISWLAGELPKSNTKACFIQSCLRPEISETP